MVLHSTPGFVVVILRNTDRLAVPTVAETPQGFRIDRFRQKVDAPVAESELNTARVTRFEAISGRPTETGITSVVLVRVFRLTVTLVIERRDCR